MGNTMDDDKPVVTISDGYVKWLRDHVGSQLIYLVYGAAVIFDEQGRVLVQARYDFDWLSVPGGVMELGEALAETARREVFEETGIQAELKGLAGVVTDPQYNLVYPNGDQVQQWTAVFWGQAVGGDLQPDGGETLETFFIEVDEFLQNTHPSHQEYVRLAQHVRAGNPPLLEPQVSIEPLRDYYPILRAAVGQEPIILPGTAALVEDEQGRILMTYRAGYNEWDIPAGFADLGETTTANIVREVYEETGLIVEPTAIFGLYSGPEWFYHTYLNGDVAQSVGTFFACRVVGGELVTEGRDDENTAVAFLTVEDILARAERGETASSVRQILLDYLDRENWPHAR